ncbi:cupin domain-containing protein [soil metagenome]
MPKKIDLAAAPRTAGTLYPSPFDEPCRARRRVRVGDAAGLTQFGVNLCTLPPGAWSSQRHWHEKEDELIYVVEGEVTLVTDAGEEILQPGDWAGFKAGDPNGHTFQNRSSKPVVLMEIGSRIGGDVAHYPDIDMKTVPGGGAYAHRDGTPYPVQPRRS